MIGCFYVRLCVLCTLLIIRRAVVTGTNLGSFRGILSAVLAKGKRLVRTTMGGLLYVLEHSSIVLRPDVKEAVAASPDEYNPLQEAIYRPQLLFGAKWANENISDKDDKVLRMGWASLGKRTLGALIVGMFILTERKLCFVRDDVKDRSGQGNIQVYDISSISDVKTSGHLALRELSFVVNGNSGRVTWERIHKENVKTIVTKLPK